MLEILIWFTLTYVIGATLQLIYYKKSPAYMLKLWIEYFKGNIQ